MELRELALEHLAIVGWEKPAEDAVQQAAHREDPSSSFGSTPAHSFERTWRASLS